MIFAHARALAPRVMCVLILIEAERSLTPFTEPDQLISLYVLSASNWKPNCRFNLKKLQ